MCKAVAKGVPSSMQVTNGLLENAMTNSGRDKFLIDGFPRNDENRAAFEVGAAVVAVLQGVGPLPMAPCDASLPGLHMLHSAAASVADVCRRRTQGRSRPLCCSSAVPRR